MKPNITVVRINLNHLLWRTRSKGQDYQFIKTSKLPSIDGWFSFFNKLFSNREPSRNPKNIIGKLVLVKNNSKSEYFQFVATCFIDDKYLDSSRRLITQYLIWFPHDDYDISTIKESLANDWGKDFISPSKGLYQLFYESSDTSKLDKENNINIERSDDDFEKLDYENIGEIEIELPEKDTIPSQPLDHKPRKDFKEEIKGAIRKGVIRASFKFIKPKHVNSKRLSRIKDKIKESDEERKRFLDCLKESFSANSEDQFLKTIVKNYKSCAKKLILASPRKGLGFFLIVNVFQRHNMHERLLDLDEKEGKAFISECIGEGASPDDECIRSIYFRLKGLAKQDKGK